MPKVSQISRFLKRPIRLVNDYLLNLPCRNLHTPPFPFDNVPEHITFFVSQFDPINLAV